MGEADRGALRLDFDRHLLPQFRGSTITSDAGLLAYRELDDTLRLIDTGTDTLADARTRKWPAYKTDQIEENGQHQVLNWFCFLGAVEALGRKPDKAVFLKNWAFVSPVVFAHYHA